MSWKPLGHIAIFNKPTRTYARNIRFTELVGVAYKKNRVQTKKTKNKWYCFCCFIVFIDVVPVTVTCTRFEFHFSFMRITNSNLEECQDV